MFIKIEDLIKRKVIRSDNAHEFLNKMTNEEIDQWMREYEEFLVRNGYEKKFPEWNVAMLSGIIDFDIMYLLSKNNQ